MRSRSLPASALALAVVALASAALADGTASLPRSWVPGRSPASVATVALEGLTRPALRVDLAALPLVEVAPSIVPETPPRALPRGDAPEVVFAASAHGGRRATIVGFDGGSMRLGRSLPTTFGPKHAGGVTDACGPRAGGVQSFSYEGVSKTGTPGTLDLVWARGFLDGASCRAVIVERRSARAKHIAGEGLYGFKTRCAACKEGERDTLHLITPQLDETFRKFVPFEHRTLPLGKGRSARFSGSSGLLTRPGLPGWKDLVGPSEATFFHLSLDVSQGLDEPEPTALLMGSVVPSGANLVAPAPITP